MKADLDRLMSNRQLDALIVAGGEGYSDVRDYMSNGAHITGGYIVKKHGAQPLLVVNGMEIEEAKKSGYPCVTYGDLGYYAVMQEKGMEYASRWLWGAVLEKAGLASGRVGVYGEGAINAYIELVQHLNNEFPQYQFVGDSKNPTLFQEAYLTKDAQEIARITSVAQRTNEVVALVWDFIAGCQANAEGVVQHHGKAVTIGDIKRMIRVELINRDLEDANTIFAQGRDAAFPHSRGEANDVLRVGQAIIFDIFPHEIGGGYYHDMTRTWCIGHAPAHVQALYDDTMTAFDIAVETFGVGKPTHTMQDAVLDFYESKGHPTVRSTSNPTEGYVHSLGHGVGLNVHESPSIHHLKKADIFQVGNFVTIEPGLYYPDQAVGVRVEDSFIVSEAGELVSISPFKKNLVIPLGN
jgi:Xaa-Pro aminopeptidase